MSTLKAKVIMIKEIDIYSKGEYPSNVLSNFYKNSFVIDGICCASMEGFLQSLKVKSPDRQRRIRLLCGIEAKKAPYWYENIRWKLTGTLYWKGNAINRFSDEYQRLLDEAYFCLYKNENFRTALADSIGYKLCHSIGKHSAKKTVLTEYEFISRLNKLREIQCGE